MCSIKNILRSLFDGKVWLYAVRVNILIRSQTFLISRPLPSLWARMSLGGLTLPGRGRYRRTLIKNLLRYFIKFTCWNYVIIEVGLWHNPLPLFLMFKRTVSGHQFTAFGCSHLAFHFRSADAQTTRSHMKNISAWFVLWWVAFVLTKLCLHCWHKTHFVFIVDTICLCLYCCHRRTLST